MGKNIENIPPSEGENKKPENSLFSQLIKPADYALKAVIAPSESYKQDDVVFVNSRLDTRFWGGPPEKGFALSTDTKEQFQKAVLEGPRAAGLLS